MNKIFMNILILLLLTSCAEMQLEAERSRLTTIQDGMSKDQVLQVMGQPTQDLKFANEEVLGWLGTVVVLNEDVVVNKVNWADKNVSMFSAKIESLNGEEPKKRVAKILPSVKGMNRNDLEFQNIKKVVGSMLQEKGYTLSENDKEVDTAVFVNFGISEPRTETKTWTEPVYDYVAQQPQPTANTTANVYNQYGQNLGSVTSQTTYGNPYAINIPQPVYRGERTHSATNTTFVRHLVIEATDYKLFLKNKEIKQFWKLTAISEGSSGDLRKVIPYLALASKGYIEKDSGSMISATVFSNDPRIQSLIAGVPSMKEKRVPASKNGGK